MNIMFEKIISLVQVITCTHDTNRLEGERWGEKRKNIVMSLHTALITHIVVRSLYLNNVSIDQPRSNGRVTAVWLETAPGKIQAQRNITIVMLCADLIIGEHRECISNRIQESNH